MSPLIESIQLVINHIESHFRIVTILDIGLVSVFIYVAMVWFRESTSRLVYIGVGFLGMIYLFARLFDLMLTSFLFHVGFAVISISLVIIFQDDIRRIIERIALWGMYGRRLQNYNIEAPIDLLVEVTTKLAPLRWGALIVLQGRDPLNRYLQGGEVLLGRISKALLFSLFDPHSAGHDGAVIIDRFQVQRFGAHLPLTKNPSQLEGLGTRHSAALGLSEHCDALILVVSEERGEVRIVERGRMKKASSSASIKTTLERFLRTRLQRSPLPMWRAFLRAHTGMKVTSVFLATIVWILFSYKTGSIVQRAFSVPIEFRNIPRNMYVVDSKPHEVRVTFSGKEAAFTLLNPQTLKISVDVGLITKGLHDIRLKDSDIDHPSNLAIDWMEPRNIKIELTEAG